MLERAGRSWTARSGGGYGPPHRERHGGAGAPDGEVFEEQRRLALAKAVRDREVKLRGDRAAGGQGRPWQVYPRASAFLVPLPELVFEDRL